MIALERLGQYKKDPNHSLEEHIVVMHDMVWNFHVTFHEHYELSVEQQMWIVLDSLLDSWENEAKTLVEQSNKLKYKKIVPKLKGELKYQMWFSESSELVNRRGIHQLTSTCKTNTKMTVVIRRPSDGKVSLFLEDLGFGAIVISIRNLVPHLV